MPFTPELVDYVSQEAERRIAEKGIGGTSADYIRERYRHLVWLIAQPYCALEVLLQELTNYFLFSRAEITQAALLEKLRQFEVGFTVPDHLKVADHTVFLAESSAGVNNAQRIAAALQHFSLLHGLTRFKTELFDPTLDYNKLCKQIAQGRLTGGILHGMSAEMYREIADVATMRHLESRIVGIRSASTYPNEQMLLADRVLSDGFALTVPKAFSTAIDDDRRFEIANSQLGIPPMMETIFATVIGALVNAGK